MKRSRNETYCCGAGGGVKVSDPDYSEWIGMDRVREFIDTGANELITSCPHCMDHFSDVKRQVGREFLISDSSEFILNYVTKM